MKSSIHTGFGWVRSSYQLFRQNPAQWLLLSLAYVVIFLGLPAILPILVLKMLVLLAVPIFTAFAISLFREADLRQDTEVAQIIARIKPYLPKLVTLGGIALVYGILMGVLTQTNSAALSAMIDAKADSAQIIAEAVPLMLKMTLLLAPLLMATWFAPMLVVHRQYSVVRAIKSSIAGCLSSWLPMLVAWLALTVLLTLFMLAVGMLVGLIMALSPPLGVVLMSLLLFASFLVALSFMLAIQYVSYRDVCGYDEDIAMVETP